MNDVKTLRLASLLLTPALLEAFLKYQRVLLAELAPAQGEWAGRFAFAHGRALAESGLDVQHHSKLKALVGDFCGRRSACLTVQQKVAELEAQAHRGLGPKQQAMLARARVELPKLTDLSEFSSRYGQEALGLLQAHELELVSLHRDLARVEGGGHVHNPTLPG
jgi:hypothetical protein